MTLPCMWKLKVPITERRGRTKMDKPETVICRLHSRKPIRVKNGDLSRFWPTCDLNLKDCNGGDSIYGRDENGVLKRWYGNSKIDDTTKERRYDERFFHNYRCLNYPYSCEKGNTSKKVTAQSHQGNYAVTSPGMIESNQNDYPSLNIYSYFANSIGESPNKPMPKDFSFEECHDKGSNPSGISNDPYSRDFKKFSSEFRNEIMQLANEYELRIRNKGYILQDIWEKCEQVCDRTNEPWHEEGFKEEEKR
ncbi:hypothetical protein Tco_1553061 [Tanacetum coccineum]